MQDAECWMLDAGRSRAEIPSSKADRECRSPDAGCSLLDTGRNAASCPAQTAISRIAMPDKRKRAQELPITSRGLYPLALRSALLFFVSSCSPSFAQYLSPCAMQFFQSFTNRRSAELPSIAYSSPIDQNRDCLRSIPPPPAAHPRFPNENASSAEKKAG